ncbi:MAG: substrate-binding domain-containing protein [Betaproteobacteria bacterium]
MKRCPWLDVHRMLRTATLLLLGLTSTQLALVSCATPPVTQDAPVRAQVTAGTYEPIPADKDSDLRLFYADGRIVTGSSALERMRAEADLTLWLAGNQFFAMEDVVRAFQRQYPAVGSVGLITLPPGVLLNAIQKGGWRYKDKDYALQPDVYASVDLGHLKTLRAKGRMNDYMIYLHNALDLMVAKGNPKGIKGIDDLGRADVRSMLPNPIDEGIMVFYARKVLVRHGLWDRLSGGRECKSCRPHPNVYFTAVHHREIPEALKSGTADAGIVWATETKNALQEGAPVETVPLPPTDSLVDDVSYAIGILTDTQHPAAAQRYLAFLASAAGQDTYARHGFIKATDATLKPIP